MYSSFFNYAPRHQGDQWSPLSIRYPPASHPEAISTLKASWLLSFSHFPPFFFFFFFPFLDICERFLPLPSHALFNLGELRTRSEMRNTNLEITIGLGLR